MGILKVENNRCGERRFASVQRKPVLAERNIDIDYIFFKILGVSAETTLERYFYRPVRKYVAKEHKRIH